MKIRMHRHDDDKIELQMTPMIDIVFQLLIFFVMTFKIVVQEGDFNIKMPLAAQSSAPPIDDTVPPMKLRLTANAAGDLTGIRLNDRGFTNFEELHQHIIGIVGSDQPSFRESAEIEIDSDYQLRYEYVVAAITSVSGYRTPQDDVVKLIERIRFSPPKKAAGS
jgi:biopolymer transport protein ExbD